MLAALAAAPVSLVQPVAAFGLVLLAAFSHFVLQVGEVTGYCLSDHSHIVMVLWG